MNVRNLIDSLNSQIDQGLISEDSEVRVQLIPRGPGRITVNMNDAS